MQQTLNQFQTEIDTRQPSRESIINIRRDELRLTQSYIDIISTISNSNEPLTAYEVARKLGYQDPNKVRPRINELVKAGRIISVGLRPCRITKNTANIWAIFE